MQIICISEMCTVFQNRATKMSYVIGYDTTISDLRQVDGRHYVHFPVLFARNTTIATIAALNELLHHQS